MQGLRRTETDYQDQYRGQAGSTQKTSAVSLHRKKDEAEGERTHVNDTLREN